MSASKKENDINCAAYKSIEGIKELRKITLSGL